MIFFFFFLTKLSIQQLENIARTLVLVKVLVVY
jgi:hypothetical protein